ncbi:MAG: Ribosomal protein L11 methyltransferase [Firmicutes bacterium]|nr:Ribosomal protein L11 methyltransferase [Bacillota bacterium]
MNNKWMEIVVVTSQAAKEAVADMLYCRGATGVIVEDTELPLGALDNEDYARQLEQDIPLEEVRVTAYLPVGPSSIALVESLRLALATLGECNLDPGRAEVVLSEVQEEDWATAWKAYFKPLRIGDRLVVKPSWEDVEAAPHEVIVEIDPGMAFGTGRHPTTVMCLVRLEKQNLTGCRVLDLGCGSGILSLAAAKLGASSVVSVDHDTVAVAVAQANVRHNRLESIVEVVESSLFSRVQGKFDVIVANLTAKIIMEALPEVPMHLAAGGVLVASGIIKEKLPAVVSALTAHGLAVLEVVSEGEWVALVAKGGEK